MATPLFAVRCKIDGKPMCIGVQTHGNGSAQWAGSSITTPKQAYDHVVAMSKIHELDDGEGGVRYVHHIDAEGNEHVITDIEADTVEIISPEKRAMLRRQRPASAAAIDALAKST